MMMEMVEIFYGESDFAAVLLIGGGEMHQEDIARRTTRGEIEAALSNVTLMAAASVAAGYGMEKFFSVSTHFAD